MYKSCMLNESSLIGYQHIDNEKTVKVLIESNLLLFFCCIKINKMENI